MRTSVKLFGVVAGMAVLFASCNKQDEIVAPVNKTIEMTIVAGSDDTKTVLGSDDGVVTWSNSGEKLAVIEAAVTNSVTTTAKETSNDGVTSDKGTTMTFGVSMSSKTAASFSYYALYPNSAYVEKPNDLTNVKVNLASTQAPTESSFGPSADVLVAKPITGLDAQPTELNLQFARVIAIGKMTIKNLNTNEKVKKVTFTAAGKAVTGSSYIDFTTADGVEYGYSGQGVDKVVLDYSDKNITANGMTAIFTCWPFSLDSGETFSVEVETKSFTFKKNITLAEGKSLAFNVGRASAFNVSFSGIDGVAKVLADGVYVVAQETNIMTVGTTGEKYRGVATLPDKNDEGSYSVESTAAWNFVYDSATDTYKINSASDNTLYIQGSSTATDFKLVEKASATSFTITKKDDGTFKIGVTSDGKTRYIGYNSGYSRFAMYATSSDLPIDLNLYPAKVVILPKIEVQETLPLSSDSAAGEIAVSWENVDMSTVAVDVYQDKACTIKAGNWISVNFNAAKTAIAYNVNINDTKNQRSAYIKVTANSSYGESETSKIIVVTQIAAGEAAVKTYQHVFTAKPSTGNKVTLSGAAWNITATNLKGYNSQNYAGVQFGDKNNNGQITLTSPSAWSYTADGVTVTKIKEVRLWLNLGGTSVTPSVTIGGTAATSDGTTVTKNSTAGSDWTKATKVTFTPATGRDTGVIVIDVQSVKAGYICAIEIDAE